MSRFKELVERDRTRPSDRERQALFTILAGNEDLFSKAHHVYDFKDHCINPDCFDQVDFSSGSRKLIELGFNLFNGYPADVLNTFSGLDEDNIKLALDAIKSRFGIE